MQSDLPHAGRLKILVVEDDPLVSSMVSDALASTGFEVTAVPAAEDALGLAVMDVPFDVLFTDIDLAGSINGWELAETMREMRPNLPVAYTSGRAQDNGAHARVPDSVFLAKPYSLSAMRSLMRELAAKTVRQAAASLVPAAGDWLGHEPVVPA